MNALFLGSHIDDVDHAGVLMQRLIASGCNVQVMAMSFAKDDVLVAEMTEAMKILGVKEWMVKDYDVRKFPEQRQMILEDLTSYDRVNHPEVVVSGSTYDKHQDHKTLAEEVIRAFYSTILQYPIAHNQPLGNHVNVFIEPTSQELETKLRAIDCYKSQAHRYWVSRDVIESNMKVWGSMIKRPYAEAYECVRLILH